jgi:hypothetical protein
MGALMGFTLSEVPDDSPVLVNVREFVYNVTDAEDLDGPQWMGKDYPAAMFVLLQIGDQA